MLSLSRTPTTKSGKAAGPELLNEANALIALSSVCPVLEEAFNARSSPKHRRACVELLRMAESETAAYGLADLLDVGNTSAFFQKFEGCFVLSRTPTVAAMAPADLLKAMGLAPKPAPEAPKPDTPPTPEAPPAA